jgi:two-component system alkaline phosphatase synthesis response regulator PhoP
MRTTLWPHKKIKILIIDDEEDICVYLKSALNKTGRYEVLATTNPFEGIDMAKEHHPDLILLDIIMPQMDGTLVAEYLTNGHITRDTLIVFFTVLTEQQDIERNDGMIGGHPFISKPISTEELIRRLDELLLRAGATK